MKSCLLFSPLFLLILLVTPFYNAIAQKKSLDQKVDSVLRLMTLDEKIGQMNQYNGDWAATGPITKDGDKQEQIKKGMLGSMLNVTGTDHTRTLQQLAMQSRMKIPLLFGQDIVHGYRTIFPIPLAEAASWDLPAIELSARVAATEGAAAGIHWTFAPMVDIARDPRWGRVMEGAGEDTYLGSLIAAARVKGFQGKGLGNTDAMMACAKHFAAYGAAVAGRDYNSVDMSNRQLLETYLPPFEAAAKAGAATFMNSFNDLNGVPASGNAYLQRTILKGQWGFKGFVVSDWGSIGEMINHGFVKDNYEAAMAAANAGSDMDMESRSYIQNLAKLVKEGKVKIAVIDDAVKRILRKKFEMGLFDDPFRFCNEARENEQSNNPAHITAAREVAKKSIVLLKNEKQLLPLSKDVKNIALIGPFVKAKSDNLGFWSYDWPDDTARIVTLWEGVKSKLAAGSNVLYAKGCEIKDTSRAGFSEAVAAAMQADVVVMTVGEARDMTGEAKSRSVIRLPGVQEELVKAIVATGKPVVVLMSAGRPLVFNWIADNVPAIVYTWWLGTQAGNAIADVLFGDYNPSAKLPISFPRTEGQIPIYYNYYNTGRPAKNDSDLNYVSSYIDLPNSPKYPFGFGLSYTSFSYGDIELSKPVFKPTEKLVVKCTVINTGNYDGEETVQLYIRDLVGSVVRPVKELKGFKKIQLKKGASTTVEFILTANDLRFYNDKLQYIFEPGDFKVFVGGSSASVKEAGFTLVK
ncbi:glycoside hydrolase family 3 N-terminal domain-containing protein [Ferruginibacter paludis]|uniref:glycoside hydrolase family 3 N-terminal domain-containing protein n=1 Tax=Ferruginibacter paludis TaxID=1310417 RepID=UPI0025B621FF|nr:glycoside hydrolase family 3 N-terminal domain-containing protein [Ferruginibacter paludis]MDN3658065.1 glycoside hydrolase family 3 N-terminal domain-containing protein [Ferruginibacter paludis]